MDNLAESQRELYIKRGDHYVLDIAGLPAAEDIEGLKAKHTELLEKENALKDQLERYNGIDPEHYTAVVQQFDNEVESALIAAGKIDDVVARRAENINREADKRLTGLREPTERAEHLAQALESKVLAGELRAAAIKAGAEGEAIDDFVRRGKSVFRLNENGTVIPLDSQSALSPVDWANSLRDTASHLFSDQRRPDTVNRHKSLAECKTDEERAAWLRAKRESTSARHKGLPVGTTPRSIDDCKTDAQRVAWVRSLRNGAK